MVYKCTNDCGDSVKVFCFPALKKIRVVYRSEGGEYNVTLDNPVTVAEDFWSRPYLEGYAQAFINKYLKTAPAQVAMGW